MALQKGTLNGMDILEDNLNPGVPVTNVTDDGGDIVAFTNAIVATRRSPHVVATTGNLPTIVAPYLVNGQTYQTQGGTAFNDGQGRLFRYYSTGRSTQTLGVNVIAGAGADDYFGNVASGISTAISGGIDDVLSVGQLLTTGRSIVCNNNSFSVINSDAINLRANFTADNSHLLLRTGDLSLFVRTAAIQRARLDMDSAGIDLLFNTNTQLRINGDPGVSGQTLTSAGPNNPPIWQSGLNENFANTNLVLDGLRNHNLNGNSLIISNGSGVPVSVNILPTGTRGLSLGQNFQALGTIAGIGSRVQVLHATEVVNHIGLRTDLSVLPASPSHQLRFMGSGGGYAGFQAAAAGGSVDYVLPTGDGISGSLLRTNGIGELDWIAAAGNFYTTNGGLTNNRIVDGSGTANLTFQGSPNWRADSLANSTVLLNSNATMGTSNGITLTSDIGSYTIGDTTEPSFPPISPDVSGMTLLAFDSDELGISPGRVYRTKQIALGERNLGTGTLFSNWDVDQSPNAYIQLNGLGTINTPTNIKTGGKYVLRVQQDGVGGHGLSFAGTWRFPGGVSVQPSTGVNSISLYNFYSDGTDIYYESSSLDLQ